MLFSLAILIAVVGIALGIIFSQNQSSISENPLETTTENSQDKDSQAPTWELLATYRRIGTIRGAGYDLNITLTLYKDGWFTLHYYYEKRGYISFVPLHGKYKIEGNKITFVYITPATTWAGYISPDYKPSGTIYEDKIVIVAPKGWEGYLPEFEATFERIP